MKISFPTTVGDLRKALENYPDDMRLVGGTTTGYDGEVRVYFNDYGDVDDGTNPSPAVIIDVDE